MAASRALIPLGVLCALTLGAGHKTRDQQPSPAAPAVASGRETFKTYCGSCHGEDAKGNGPAAIAMKTPPPDLTTLARRHKGKYPDGFVGAVIKFGRSFASHGSEEMPVWGGSFRRIDPVNDPTGQQHVDQVVAYIKTLQVK